MRLIDADEFINDIVRQTEFLQVNDFQVIPVVDVSECLGHAPTVKAIPIEFIEERIKKALAFTHSKAEGNIMSDGCVVTVVSASFTAQVLANLLEAWEGENEENI